MTEKAPGIFSAHAGTTVKFFDTVTQAQDWAENHATATLRRDYGAGWLDVAHWANGRWTYAKLSAKQLAGHTIRGKKKRS